MGVPDCDTVCAFAAASAFRVGFEVDADEKDDDDDASADMDTDSDLKGEV